MVKLLEVSPPTYNKRSKIYSIVLLALLSNSVAYHAKFHPNLEPSGALRKERRKSDDKIFVRQEREKEGEGERLTYTHTCA